MKAAPKPANELQRLSALYGYDILDTLPEQEFDDITRIASEICGTPISLITLIDGERQWFKSKVGLKVAETNRDLSFCAHAILQPEEMLIVDNPKDDERFADHPFVIGAPNFAFYAGVPLVNATGYPLGTLCVIDNKPKQLTDIQKDTLRALARLVVANLEIRKNNREIAQQKAEMESVNIDLSKFADDVANDVQSPLSNLVMTAKYLREHYSPMIDSAGIRYLAGMEETAGAAISMVNAMRDHTRKVHGSGDDKVRFTFGNLAAELRKQLSLPAGFSFITNNEDVELYISRTHLQQILMSLCVNAIKCNDKKEGKLVISVKEIGNCYLFTVQDNGQGIKPEDQESIFDLFYTTATDKLLNKRGTETGLSIVKRLVEKMNGSIKVVSESGVGTTFEVLLKK